MYFNSVSGIPQLPFETVGLLLVFAFCHILAPLHKNRAHRLVSIRSDAVLYYLLDQFLLEQPAGKTSGSVSGFLSKKYNTS